MSDPMSKSEVEDVLSSIRRLVSEDHRIVLDAQKVDAPQSDRLILTPAQRISDDAVTSKVVGVVDDHAGAVASDTKSDADSDVDPEDADGAAPENFEFNHDDEAEESRGENPAALDLDNQADDFDADADVEQIDWSEDAPDDVDDAEGEADNDGPEEHETSDGRDTVPFTLEAEYQRDVEISQDDGDATASDAGLGSLGEKIAALETLIARRSERWEPEDAGTSDYAGKPAPPLDWENQDDDVATETQSEGTQSEGDDSDDLPHEESGANEALDQKDADDTAKVFGEWGVSDDEPMDYATSNTADIEPASDGDKADAGESAGLDETQAFAVDDDILDETALRDLVSEIVREELQGALGERITRNVRKLVRREIHRALAAQDLD